MRIQDFSDATHSFCILSHIKLICVNNIELCFGSNPLDHLVHGSSVISYHQKRLARDETPEHRPTITPDSTAHRRGIDCPAVPFEMRNLGRLVAPYKGNQGDFMSLG